MSFKQRMEEARAHWAERQQTFRNAAQVLSDLSDRTQVPNERHALRLGVSALQVETVAAGTRAAQCHGFVIQVNDGRLCERCGLALRRGVACECPQ